MSWRTEWWKSLPQNRIQKKKMKRNKDSLRDLWDNLNVPTFSLQGSQKEKEERKDLRKYLKK